MTRLHRESWALVSQSDRTAGGCSCTLDQRRLIAVIAELANPPEVLTMAEYLRCVTVAWNWTIFDELMATDASGFIEAAVPEIGSTHPESKHWVSNYFLNSVLRAQYGSPTRELVAALLRRVTIAFEGSGPRAWCNDDHHVSFGCWF